MTEKSQWMKDYEAAYRAANGKSCEVIAIKPGWYSVIRGPEISWRNYRQQEIVDMTANLERRLDGREAA